MSLNADDFPNHWRVVPIDHVAFFQEGPGVRTHQYTESGVKLLNGSNINGGFLDLSKTDRYISDSEAFGKYKHFLVEPGDLLIACSGVVVDKFEGKIAYAEEEHLPLCMNTSTMRFRSLNEDVLYLDYFRRFLQTSFFKTQLQKLITGSAQLNFGPSHIKQMVVPLPPLPEQKRIAAILDKADAIRRKRQQAIQLADDFLRAVFLDMFGDPATNPKGWEVKPLSAGIRSIASGWSASGENRPCSDGEKGVLKISAVTSGVFKPEENKTVPLDQIPDGKKLLFPKRGDLLFSRANTRELVAASCIVMTDVENVFLPDKLWLIETDQNKLLPEFLNYLLWQPRFKERLTSQATGTSGSMLNISKSKFEETDAFFPNMELQRKFKRIYWVLQEALEVSVSSRGAVDSLFESLSQKAFSGQL